MGFVGRGSRLTRAARDIIAYRGDSVKQKTEFFFIFLVFGPKPAWLRPFGPKQKAPGTLRGLRIVKKSPSRTTCAYGWDTYREICRRECARLQSRVRGSAANFVPRGILGGRNFCRATARRNGFPLKRVVLRHAHHSSSMASTICWAMYLWPWMVGWPSLAVLVRGMGT